MSKPKEKQTKGAKIAAIISTFLWVAGFGLAFVVPAGSRWFWVPDAMLLIGFFPLLYAWKPGWPWVVFGVCNFFIGCVLQLANFIPDDNFTREMIMVRKHLAEQHSPLTWMFIGIISTIFGVIRMLIHLVQWIRRRSKKSDPTTSVDQPSTADPST